MDTSARQRDARGYRFRGVKMSLPERYATLDFPKRPFA
jgi:hypothetical protein